MVTPTDHVRAEQRWKWARMLRDTGLTFSGAKDKLGAETFLASSKDIARKERYQEDMLFAVDALLVGEAQVWYESVEHKLHSWQDFERRFRRSFANQATPEELLTELRRRTQGKGHWTTNCPTIECFKCHKKGHMARACPESEDNVERKDIACQVCGQRGVTVPECGRCSYLFDRSGNEQVEARGSVAVPLKSHTRPKESDRADDALIRWLYRLEQQDKLKVPTLGEVLAHCEWPRDDTLIPMPGGGTISEWCLRDLSAAAGERPAGQADEGIEKIAEPCETRKQNAWSQGEFVTLELGGEAEESTQEEKSNETGNVRRACELARTSHTHFTRCQARSEPRQMRICCQSVQFLGYVLDSSGLRIDSERVRPIHDYPTPRNVKQVRRLLGMVGWYSRFIKNEAEIKVPLARLLRKDTPFVWGADQEQAFATLKQSLSEAPVLVRPDFDKEFAIQTDASDYAIGAVLTQEREDDGAQHQRGATAFVCRRCQGSNRKDCTVSPAGDGRASGGVELREKRRARDVARTEEESRCWRRRHGQCWSSWWRPVNRWKNGTARHSRRFFVARLKRKFCCWRRGRRRLRFVAQVRRRRKAHGSAGELRGGTAWLGVPAVRRATAAPATDGVSPRRATTAPASPPGAYQEQQQHRQLPRRQPQQQHQREEVRVEVRPLSPVAGPSSLSGNTAAPARIRGENFGGLEPVGFVPGLDPPRGACFECHEPGHTRRQCRKPYNGDLCTNCGRRGVKVRHCPRCSRGWKKSQRNFHSKRAAARKQLWKALGGGRC
ncbi:unnamed protein product [Trichogramma brassicae]|uniref:RNA-directed DNA polymerase n=1 Tax=Trichogramma brassicae TaxID=86971 RepID=A0A6H5J041_9HYME|nr:unnamed protein product [Trichogramma brassicae]